MSTLKPQSAAAAAFRNTQKKITIDNEGKKYEEQQKNIYIECGVECLVVCVESFVELVGDKFNERLLGRMLDCVLTRPGANRHVP